MSSHYCPKYHSDGGRCSVSASADTEVRPPKLQTIKQGPFLNLLLKINLIWTVMMSSSEFILTVFWSFENFVLVVASFIYFYFCARDSWMTA
jgi:hypothetical protein